MSDKMYEPMFSINSHDSDGDSFEEGIYLHFGETRIRVAENLPEFDRLLGTLARMRDEIEENLQ